MCMIGMSCTFCKNLWGHPYHRNKGEKIVALSSSSNHMKEQVKNDIQNFPISNIFSMEINDYYRRNKANNK